MESRLTLIEDQHELKGHRWYSLYRCICNNTIVTLRQSVNSGKTKSCGCLTKDNANKKVEAYLKAHPPKESFLTLLKEKATFKQGRNFNLYKCACGREVENRSRDVLTGKVISCGCKQLENLKYINLTHGLSTSRLYRVWATMKDRCFREKAKEYQNYGGRGITLCKDWLEYIPFHNWAMSNGYKQGLSIERVDVNGNYEPSNCTWIPLNQQSGNTRTSLGWNKAAEIRRLFKLGKSTRELATLYKVNIVTIRGIVSGRTYKHTFI